MKSRVTVFHPENSRFVNPAGLGVLEEPAASGKSSKSRTGDGGADIGGNGNRSGELMLDGRSHRGRSATVGGEFKYPCVGRGAFGAGIDGGRDRWEL
jgi:hypothetical protein